MDFMKALELAISVINEQGSELDEIYLYEPNKQVRVYLKDCDGSEQFVSDEPLPEQVFLGGIVDNRIVKKQLSLDTLFSARWEVRLRKNQHLKVTRKMLGKTAETFLDYTPVGREEVADV